MTCNDKISILLLHKMRCLRTREKLMLFELIDSAHGIIHLTQKDVEVCIGRTLKPGVWMPETLLTQVEQDVRILENLGIGFVFYWAPHYPHQLREIYDPPFLLFYRGTLPLFNVPSVGIVGTRFPSGDARSAAYKTGFELSCMGLHVVSGLAKGIDREAHLGSLEALTNSGIKGPIPPRGISIGVLGNGIDTVYPSSSRKTAEKILDNNGVIFSEYFPGVLPLKYHFPARNRIISGLSRSVVIIQAPSRSGALITADYALEQGRDIFIHKAGLTGKQGAGTLKLCREGAPVIKHCKEIYADWGLNVDLSYLNCHISKEQTIQMPGKKLAFMLEHELSGKVHIHNGEYF